MLDATVMSELAIYRVGKLVVKELSIYTVGKLREMFCCITCKVFPAK